ncbi:hypothetical protein COW95_00945 [Candidatus Peregrinibacteria bacterium CG22_combo_CG10-13_8_21_14_all_49_11]|nr:MAG: hypothetical protein COW95_00945 [Candidatus Peregrinibacteria bacterium CG22_combo_CG10-13_8_21_14_all_49_11]
MHIPREKEDGDQKEPSEKGPSVEVPTSRRAFLQWLGAATAALTLGGKGSAEEQKDKNNVPEEIRRILGANAICIENATVFEHRGKFYMVDPSDPQGERMFILQHGECKVLEQVLKGAKADLDNPYIDPVAIYATEQKRNFGGKHVHQVTTYYFPRKPDGDLVLDPRTGKPVCDLRFTRIWRLGDTTVTQLQASQKEK